MAAENSPVETTRRSEPNLMPDLPELPYEIAPEHVEYLRKLIETFNRSAADLQETYRSLQEKFDRLNLRLEETNRSLSRSLAEQERLSDYLTSILESLSSGVLVVDTVGTVTLFNRGAEEMTGIPASEAVGKPYREIMGREFPDELTPFGTLSAGKGISQVEKTLVSRSGEKIAVGYSISPLMNRHGIMTGAVEIFMDLRRIKALEDELSRMDKLAALGQMAATMAHKIRNPLGGIVGFAGLLELELRENERGRRLIGKITEGVDKLNRIVSSLVSYTSRLNLQPRPYDLGAGLAEMLGVFEGSPNYAKHNSGCLSSELDPDRVEVAFSLFQPEGPVTVEADRDLLNGAVRKIVQNAVDSLDSFGEVHGYVLPGDSCYTPPCPVTSAMLGKLRASSRLIASRLECGIAVVTDTGCGMSAEAEKNLFVPFFTTKENGIGLGLASAKKIVEAHHGELWIASLESRGTSVGIILPRVCTLTRGPLLPRV